MTLRNEALVAVFVLLAARGGLATAADGVTVGDVSWTRTAASAVLANSVASRAWTITATPTGDSVATTALARVGGANLVASPSNEFTLALGPLAVDSSEFRLSSLTAAACSDGITATFVFKPL